MSRPLHYTDVMTRQQRESSRRHKMWLAKFQAEHAPTMTASVQCGRCGNVLILASGHIARDMSTERMKELAEAKGWCWPFSDKLQWGCPYCQTGEKV